MFVLLKHMFFIGLITCGALIMGGCKEKEATPEDTAIAFFTAIYVNNDVEAAKAISVEPLQDLLEHYHTPEMIQRHMFNLTMEDPEITVTESSADFFRKVATSVRLKVHFVGRFDGGKVEDDRTVRLTKKGMRWYIVEVMPDKFATNG